MGAQARTDFNAQFVAKWGPGGPASGLNEEQGAEILRRLLALNRERSSQAVATSQV